MEIIRKALASLNMTDAFSTSENICEHEYGKIGKESAKHEHHH